MRWRRLGATWGQLMRPQARGEEIHRVPVFAFTAIFNDPEMDAVPLSRTVSSSPCRHTPRIPIAFNKYSRYAISMEWEVEFTNEFEAWWHGLSHQEQDSVATSVELLRSLGPSLPRPHADTLKGSKHPNMKELRTQHQGRPIRTLFAFDPRRSAILLIGGNKTGDKRFYAKMIPIADELFDEHLRQLKNEGLI